MKKDRSSLSRRSVMAGALMAPAAALAQSSAQGVQKAFARTSASGKVWSSEYWAQKGDVKLYMFRKRASAPESVQRAAGFQRWEQTPPPPSPVRDERST